MRNAGHILGSNISVDLYVGRTLFKTFITFGHHILLYLVGVALGLIPLTWIALLSIPGIALLLVNGFWVIIVLAFMCARFRDVELIVRNLLQVAFLVTPVFWNFQQISPNQRFMVDYNRFFIFFRSFGCPVGGNSLREDLSGRDRDHAVGLRRCCCCLLPYAAAAGVLRVSSIKRARP